MKMIEVERKLCDLCGTCVGVCSSDAVYIERDKLRIDSERCVQCCNCVRVCPVGALKEDS